MPTELRVMPWSDPVVDVAGFDPRSWYVETFWLPTLGPTTLLLLRHLADRFERHPDGITLPIAATAAALGLGPKDSESSPLVRSLTRLGQFGLAQPVEDGVVAVRRTLPPIQRRHVRRLPAALQATHAEWVAETSQGPVALARRRARRVALTMLVDGEALDSVERVLHASGFHPALAHEAVRWARDRHKEIERDDDCAIA